MYRPGGQTCPVKGGKSGKYSYNPSIWVNPDANEKAIFHCPFNRCQKAADRPSLHPQTEPLRLFNFFNQKNNKWWTAAATIKHFPRLISAPQKETFPNLLPFSSAQKWGEKVCFLLYLIKHQPQGFPVFMEKNILLICSLIHSLAFSVICCLSFRRFFVDTQRHTLEWLLVRLLSSPINWACGFRQQCSRTLAGPRGWCILQRCKFKHLSLWRTGLKAHDTWRHHSVTRGNHPPTGGRWFAAGVSFVNSPDHVIWRKRCKNLHFEHSLRPTVGDFPDNLVEKSSLQHNSPWC